MSPCSLTPIEPAKECGISELPQRKYVIKNDKLYIDGAYFGYLTGRSSELITVRCDNGNTYMQGQEYEIYLV